MLSNGQVVTTLLGTDVTVTINSSGVYIDNAMVTVADIVADNGVECYRCCFIAIIYGSYWY